MGEKIAQNNTNLYWICSQKDEELNLQALPKKQLLRHRWGANCASYKKPMICTVSNPSDTNHINEEKAWAQSRPLRYCASSAPNGCQANDSKSMFLTDIKSYPFVSGFCTFLLWLFWRVCQVFTTVVYLLKKAIQCIVF